MCRAPRALIKHPQLTNTIATVDLLVHVLGMSLWWSQLPDARTGIILTLVFPWTLNS
jgi:hypothetical protein